MNMNRNKNDEKRQDGNLHLGRRKSDSPKKMSTLSHQDVEKPAGHHMKDSKQLSSLHDTLKDMIKTGRQSSMQVEMALTGFYKEISKSIQRK